MNPRWSHDQKKIHNISWVSVIKKCAKLLQMVIEEVLSKCPIQNIIGAIILIWWTFCNLRTKYIIIQDISSYLIHFTKLNKIVILLCQGILSKQDQKSTRCDNFKVFCKAFLLNVFAKPYFQYVLHNVLQ